MGFPASGIESAWRNNIDDVAFMLEQHHHGSYMIWNLSDKRYDYSKFSNNVFSYIILLFTFFSLHYFSLHLFFFTLFPFSFTSNLLFTFFSNKLLKLQFINLHIFYLHFSIYKYLNKL